MFGGPRHCAVCVSGRPGDLGWDDSCDSVHTTSRRMDMVGERDQFRVSEGSVLLTLEGRVGEAAWSLLNVSDPTS